MGGLHRGDDIEITEEGKVIGMNDLGMLDAPAPVIGTAQDRGIDLQHLPVGRIPDAVSGHGKSMFIGPLAIYLEFVKRCKVEAQVVRIVRIGLDHAGTPGPQGPVGK